MDQNKLTPNEAVLNSALSPYQVSLNELLDGSCSMLEQFIGDSASASFDLALELAPALDNAKQSLGGTDLTRTLASLQSVHHLLLTHHDAYLENPLFEKVQDLLIEQISPLQAGLTPPPSSPNSFEEPPIEDAHANNNGTDTGVNASNPPSSVKLDSPIAADSQTPTVAMVSVADLMAKISSLSKHLQELSQAKGLTASDVIVINGTLVELTGQSNLLDSSNISDIIDLNAPDNEYAQFERISESLEDKLSPEALAQFNLLVNPITPIETSPIDQGSEGGFPGEGAVTIPDAGENALSSSNPADPKSVLDPNRIPTSVRSQFLIGEAGRYFYKDRNNAIAFTDAGGKLKADNADPQVASAMVAIAKAKGWGSLKLRGSAEFKAAVWLAAQLADIPTEGYTPTDLDRALLAKAHDDLQTNSIAPGDKLKPDFDGGKSVGKSTGSKEKMGNADTLAIDPKVARALAASETGFSGTVKEFGKAPYRFSTLKDEPVSYFIRLSDAAGREHVFWGKEIESAVQSANPQDLVGKSIVLYERGKRPVQTLKPVRDKEGNVIRQEPISAMRNEWAIVRNPDPEMTVAKVTNVESGDIADRVKVATNSPPLPPSHTADIQPNSNNPFIAMAQAFADGDPNRSAQAIEKFPSLVHVYASQKALWDQAQITFSDPAELANAKESINKVLYARILQGKISPPLVNQPSYPVTIDAIFEHNPQVSDGAINPGNSSTDQAKPTERVLRFTDAKNSVHELVGVDLSALSPDQLVPGAPVMLTQRQDANNSDRLIWQAQPRDPAIVLHGVAAAEWAREIGANDDQARSLASKAMQKLQSFSQTSQSPLAPPLLRSGQGPLLPPAVSEVGQENQAPHNIDKRNRRLITPTHAR